MEEEKIVNRRETVTEPENKSEKLFCTNCGARLLPGQTFCPKCGHKVGEAVTATLAPVKSGKKKPVVFIAVVLAAAILAAVGFSASKNRGPDLKAVYNEYCDFSYADVADDGSYLSIDTNPNDLDDYSSYEAYDAVRKVNEALELPGSVLERMNHTTALNGIQSYSNDYLEVTWSYHPDNGLEVIYSLK